MQAVAGITPRQHVGKRAQGSARVALRQQIGAFMPGLGVAAARGIGFGEYDVPDDAETYLAPGDKELIGGGPAVEGHGKSMGTQYAVHLGKGRAQPAVMIIAWDPPPVA